MILQNIFKASINNIREGTSFLPHVAAVLTLGVLLIYTFISFLPDTATGFKFSSLTGIVGAVFHKEGGDLKQGDRILAVNGWALNEPETASHFYQNGQSRQLELAIERDGHYLTVDWQMPSQLQGFELIDRLTTQWWLSYVFWLVGLIALLFLRPKDYLWLLFIAFNLITAVWMITSNAPRIFFSRNILSWAMWMSVPIYWHFHWELPESLYPLPRKFWLFVYIIFSTISLFTLWALFPTAAIFSAFAATFLGSLLLILVRLVWKRDRRQNLILYSSLVIMVGLGITSTFALRGNLPNTALAPLLLLPLLPLSYLYTIFRGQLQTFRFRANKIIIYYFLVAIVSLTLFVVVGILNRWVQLNSAANLTIIVVGLVVCVVTAYQFSSFERILESRLLGMRLAPSKLLEEYAQQITMSLSNAHLVQILQKDVLPTLMIRQSILLGFEVSGGHHILYSENVNPSLFDEASLQLLKPHYNQYLPPNASDLDGTPYAWVRLILPLTVGQTQLGIWILGQRDPDDLYAHQDMPMLNALASQTAIALQNINQSHRLQILYQTNIDEQEKQRVYMALELHDDILNELGVLALHANQTEDIPVEFNQVYERLVSKLRRTIHELRPAMLNYSLHIALEELTNNIAKRVSDRVVLMYNIKPSMVRYPQQIEQHMFRIVQQSIENAVDHAQADVISVYGELQDAWAEIVIEDDGIGFNMKNEITLFTLLEQRHFGLVGMIERADLIGGDLTITSKPKEGTKIRLQWQAHK